MLYLCMLTDILPQAALQLRPAISSRSLVVS